MAVFLANGHCPFVGAAHQANVFLGLSIGRYAVVPLDRSRTGVVRGERKVEIAVERVEKRSQVTRARQDVLPCIKHVSEAEEAGRGRHELHDPTGTGWRNSSRIE